MKHTSTVVLLCILFAVVHAGYYQSRITVPGGCDTYTCGKNARCTISEGRPVCSCLNNYMGDPLSYCEKAECLIDSDCNGNQVCKNNKCVDVCLGSCGRDASCRSQNRIAVCYCPSGYTGDPYTSCIADPQAACKPSPCGENTKCEVVNGVPVCTCLPGYIGSALTGCRHECESDVECPGHLACSSSFKCENPCKCGTNAECQVVNHQARCSCPNNWQGNPLISCHPECTTHSDCPRNKPACLYQKCMNPCEGACGVNADCNLRDITPVCSCPRHMTGNPFVSCRLFVPQDLCEPNPCGTNAVCTPGHDNTGRERPVCTCPSGYFGNALINCQRGECQTNAECPDNRACIDFRCQNPCTGKECGPSATCTARRHIAVCTCPGGTRGDALFNCNPIGFSSNSVARYRLY